MNIGEAASVTHLNAKTIRFYEDIKLVMPKRATNGYRIYDEDDIHRLKFIQRARSLGFTVDECRHLLMLYEDKNRPSSKVKKIATDRIEEIDIKIKELRSLKETLMALADNCSGDDRPSCPILEDLSGG